MNGSTPEPSSSVSPGAVVTAGRPSRLWLWFVLAFVLQAAAWTTWFIIASRHPVEEVPLATSGR